MKKIMVAALAALMLASCGNSAEPMAAKAEYIYGKIDSVTGNDIVLLMAENNEQADSAAADDSESTSDKKTSGEGSGRSKRERPENFDPENMPEGFDPSKFGGERPERSDSEGDSSDKTKREKPQSDDSTGDSSKTKRERPEGFTMSENGEMPEGFDPSKIGGERPELSSNKDDSGSPDSGDAKKKKPSGSGKSSKYTLTGETEELRIPVGTTVTTSAGVKTDFDALSAGDMIKCSVEKNSEGQDVITEVWILEN